MSQIDARKPLWQRRDVLGAAIAAVLVLAVPLLASPLNSEVNWGMGDFAIIGILLFGAILVYALSTQQMQRPFYRAIAGLAVLAVVMVVWAELAVGIFT